MATHDISRRALLTASASGSALFLVGCGSAGGLGFVGGGPGTTTTMPAIAYSPDVLAAGEDGSLYEIDASGHRVAQILPDGSYGWETPPGALNWPKDVAIDADGHVCVASMGDDVIVVYDEDGAQVGEIGAPGTAPGEFRVVRDLVFDADGRLYAADSLNHRVQVLDGTGAVVRVIGEPGRAAGQLNGPKALALDSHGHLHVLDAGNWRIQVFDAAGAFLREYGYFGNGADEFLTPTDLVIDAEDRVYVVDPAMRRVLVYENAGHDAPSVLQFEDEEGTRLIPMRIALGPNGDLLLNAYPVPDLTATS